MKKLMIGSLIAAGLLASASAMADDQQVCLGGYLIAGDSGVKSITINGVINQKFKSSICTDNIGNYLCAKTKSGKSCG